MRRVGSKEKLRRYFSENVGRVLEASELQVAAGGAAEFARRIRELRDEEGWPILTHNDSADLKPGQYILHALPTEKKDASFVRGISARLRAEVLDRDGSTCQMCGLAAGEVDPITSRKVRLHLGHIKDKSLGGKDELSNLRTLCSSCNQGAKNVTGEKPGQIWLLSQIRRAARDEQQAVYQWLRSKFGDG
jgi:5-methylcytosine-specific restriction endonuclease McrA